MPDISVDDLQKAGLLDDFVRVLAQSVASGDAADVEKMLSIPEVESIETSANVAGVEVDLAILFRDMFYISESVRAELGIVTAERSALAERVKELEASLLIARGNEKSAKSELNKLTKLLDEQQNATSSVAAAPAATAGRTPHRRRIEGVVETNAELREVAAITAYARAASTEAHKRAYAVLHQRMYKLYPSLGLTSQGADRQTYVRLKSRKKVSDLLVGALMMHYEGVSSGPTVLAGPFVVMPAKAYLDLVETYRSAIYRYRVTLSAHINESAALVKRVVDAIETESTASSAHGALGLAARMAGETLKLDEVCGVR